MKKICICTTVSVTMKAFVVETAKYLHNECGYDVTLICNEDGAFEKSLPKYLHFTPVHMARGIDLSALKSVCQLYKIFKKNKFDMVQYSTPNASCYASIAAKLAKVSIRLYCQWGIRYVGMHGFYRKIFKSIEKMVCTNSTDVRAVSPLNKEFAVSEGLYQSKKATVVGNGGTIGVDLSEYNLKSKNIWRDKTRKEYKLNSNDFVFGFSGRVSIDKGCKELLSAFKELEATQENIKLLIVGPLEDNCGLDDELINWARSSENVIMTGMVSKEKMREYYSAMDVLVHPTYREGFGMVIQEAGALAVPVITTQIPGASEVMENGVSSIHIKAKDKQELFKVMLNIAITPKTASIMGEKAYERTKQLYERNIMLEHQKLDYKKLLEGE